MANSPTNIRRFSSRRQRLDRSFLAERLRGARGYDRIAGYFSSSLLELVGEELDSVSGPIRVICNSDLDPLDVKTANSGAVTLALRGCEHHRGVVRGPVIVPVSAVVAQIGDDGTMAVAATALGRPEPVGGWFQPQANINLGRPSQLRLTGPATQ